MLNRFGVRWSNLSLSDAFTSIIVRVTSACIISLSSVLLDHKFFTTTITIKKKISIDDLTNSMHLAVTAAWPETKSELTNNKINFFNGASMMVRDALQVVNMHF